MSVTVLIVDDDAEVREVVDACLTAPDFVCIQAGDAARARTIMATTAVDVVVLDIGLPGEDGVSFAASLSGAGQPGIVYLSGAGDMRTKLNAFGAGGDDYLTKPFEPRELLARVRAVCRRRSVGQPGEGRQRPVGDGVLDLDERCVLAHDGSPPIALTPMEYDLLKALSDCPGTVLDRDTLAWSAHHKEWTPFDRSIDIRIARLRRKLAPLSGGGPVIETIRGQGYRLVPPRSGLR